MEIGEVDDESALNLFNALDHYVISLGFGHVGSPVAFED